MGPVDTELGGRRRADRGEKPPTRVRRRLTPGDRRAELVEAALRVLRAGDARGNWVAAVTAEAGAAKGTFYVYFPSWEHMLALVRERLTDAASAPIRDALAGRGRVDWWRVLEAECRRFIEVAAEFGPQHALIFHPAVPQPSGALPRSGPALLAAALERGIAEGSFRPVDVESASRLLFAVLHEAVDAVLEGGERERWIAACVALARGYLASSTERLTDGARQA